MPAYAPVKPLPTGRSGRVTGPPAMRATASRTSAGSSDQAGRRDVLA